MKGHPSAKARPGALGAEDRPGAPAEAPGSGSRGRALFLGLGAAVVLAQVGLATLAFVPAPHNGGDNATYISLAHALLETGGYRELFDPAGLPHTKYPPVFPVLLAVWIAAGARTWVALKTVPMVFTTLAVAFTYLWAAGRRGPWMGAAIALLFAASSALLDASHWILSEPPFLAFTLLALWAFDRSERGERPAAVVTAATEPGPGEPARSAAAMLALGGAAAVLAYFTRSAGLPLVIAALGWLAWRRRARAAAVFGASVGVLALAWWLRSRGVPGHAGYGAEFWMVNPYDPSLGRIGPSGLVTRFVSNAVAYTTSFGPGGVVGTVGAWVTVLGVLLVLLGAVGWTRRVREGPGVAEIFLPLYLGLVLLWPEVWSGDRFALPLYPLVFFYAGEAVLAGAARLSPAIVPSAGLLAVLAVAAPSGLAWKRSLPVAEGCAELTRLGGPWACYGAAVEEFVAAAVWSGEVLPAGSSVLTRKPSIFYLMSGLPSRTFPFSDDPDVLLAEARSLGTDYLMIDVWDRQAYTFPGQAVLARPGAFCGIAALQAGSRLVGILPGEGDRTRGVPNGPVTLADCPAAMFARDEAGDLRAYSSPVIPLLASRRADP